MQVKNVSDNVHKPGFRGEQKGTWYGVFQREIRIAAKR
jgi:hypothetical protein